MSLKSSGAILRKFWIDSTVNSDPVDAVAWFRRNGSLAVLVADYADGKRATLRTGGVNWKLSITTVAGSEA